MKTLLALLLLIPSLSWSIIFETDGIRCAGDDNGNNGISGLAYCEEGDTKFYGEVKDNAHDGIVFIEQADNSIVLAEFTNDRLNGIAIKIKDNQFTLREFINSINFGWDIEVNDIKNDVLFELSFFENNKWIDSYPTIHLKFFEKEVVGRFYFLDEQGYCRDNTFSGSFEFNLANSFDNRSGYLGKVNENCKFNGPVVQMENGKFIKYIIANNDNTESELSKKEFSKQYGKEFDEFNLGPQTDYSKSLKEFGNRFLNFSLRVNNIGIQDFSSNYFLIGSQEQIYKKFDKYINEFYE